MEPAQLLNTPASDERFTPQQLRARAERYRSLMVLMSTPVTRANLLNSAMAMEELADHLDGAAAKQ
jgi:hypothetical protein